MEKKTMFSNRNEGDEGAVAGRTMRRFVLLVLAVFMLVATMPASASAEEAARNDKWQFDAKLYMWGASIGGRTVSGDPIDVGFDELLKNLDLAFMGGFEARKGYLSLLADVLYMNLEADNSGKVTGPRGLVTLKGDATLKLQAWVVTPAVAYNIADNGRFRVDILTGARYLWLKPELDLHVTGPFRSRDKQISDSGDEWDGIVGIRGGVNLDKNWYVPYYADMGTGESRFTWQAMGGVGYRISNAVDVVAAYRYLYWKLGDNKVLDKLDLSGPLVGIKYRF